MRFLSAPMETSVIVNWPGPGQMDTSKMADTLTAERVRGMSRSHTSSGCGWCTPHCTRWRRCWLPTEGTECAPLRSMGCTSGRGCSSLGRSKWWWRGTQRRQQWYSPRRVLVCSLKWIQNTSVVNHFSSETRNNKKPVTELSPAHAVTYVALTVANWMKCHCDSLASTPSIVLLIAYPFSKICGLPLLHLRMDQCLPHAWMGEYHVHHEV